MQGRVSGRRSVAVLALAILTAGALAASTAGAAAPVTKAKARKIAKKVANKQITARAPGLTVNHANTSSEATNVLWAVVTDGAGAADITLVRAGQPGTTVGTYSQVDFGQDISQCAWIATRGHPSTTVENAGFAQTHLGSNSQVRVAVRNDAGTLEAGSFHLQVIC